MVSEAGGHDERVGIQIMTYLVQEAVAALTNPACDYANSCDLTWSRSLVICQRWRHDIQTPGTCHLLAR